MISSMDEDLASSDQRLMNQALENLNINHDETEMPGVNMPLLHDSSELLMESLGSNTFVQNQINELTSLDQQIAGIANDAYQVIDGQSDSNIDIDNLTES